MGATIVPERATSGAAPTPLSGSVKTSWPQAMPPVEVLIPRVRDQHQLRQDCRTLPGTQGSVDIQALKRYKPTAAKGGERNHGSKGETL